MLSPKLPIRPEFVELAAGLAVALVLLAIARSDYGWLGGWGRAARKLARRRTLVIVLAALLGPVIRLALLAVAPVPEPVIHDEFVHLLVADTLRHGRIANPPLPLSDFFETIYVLQRPVYAAGYPIGNGAFLALGWVLTGYPWFGVWIAMVLCCGSVTWFQYRWNPPLAACAGGLLFSLLFGISSGWIDTYWGGAVPAAGGALALGALPDLLRTWRIRSAALVAAGWTLAWFTRPYESVLLGILVAAAVLARLLKNRTATKPQLARGGGGARVLIALLLLGLVGIADAAVSGWHNLRVTGDPWLLPYQLTQRQYGVPQGFVWQKEAPLPERLNPQQKEVYFWQRDLFRQSWSPVNRLLNLKRVWAFYIGYPLTIPLLLGLLGWRSRKARVLIMILAASLVWSSLYWQMVPHYLAPVAAVLLALMMRGFLVLSYWRLPVDARRAGALPAGACLAIGLWLASALAGLRILHPFLLMGHAAPPAPRAAISLELQATPGTHLVFVRYAAGDSAHTAWVYNGAQLEGAKVIWANDLGPERNRELLHYFPSRMAWTVATDEGILKRYGE
jgi:hypothetical protein